MVGAPAEAYAEGRSVGAFLFYKEAIEALNEAASESKDGKSETTTYENVADFLLAIYRKLVETSGVENLRGDDGKVSERRKSEEREKDMEAGVGILNDEVSRIVNENAAKSEEGFDERIPREEVLDVLREAEAAAIRRIRKGDRKS